MPTSGLSLECRWPLPRSTSGIASTPALARSPTSGKNPPKPSSGSKKPTPSRCEIQAITVGIASQNRTISRLNNVRVAARANKDFPTSKQDRSRVCPQPPLPIAAKKAYIGPENIAVPSSTIGKRPQIHSYDMGASGRSGGADASGTDALCPRRVASDGCRSDVRQSG